MVEWLAWAGMGLVAAAATAVVVTQPDSRNFPVPVSIARERLASAPLPADVMSLAAAQAAPSREGANLVWILGSGDNRGEIRIEFEADGATTNVSWSLDFPRSAGPGSGILNSELIGDVAEAALEEHIDATLTGRAFDHQKAILATAKELQANPQKLDAFGNALRSDMIAIHEQISETAKGTAFPSRSGAVRVETGSGSDFTKPMTQLP